MIKVFCDGCRTQTNETIDVTLSTGHLMIPELADSIKTIFPEQYFEDEDGDKSTAYFELEFEFCLSCFNELASKMMSARMTSALLDNAE